MEHIEIIPLVGIKLNDITIPLSASRETVANLLGKSYEEIEASWYYFSNELRFDFDENGKVEFIEFLSGIEGNVQPQIYGVSAFDTDADKIYELMKNKNCGDIDDHENGYSYAFLNISAGIYRTSIPADVAEMIKKAEKAEESMRAEEIEYEIQTANHWATIGIGVKDYYK